MNTFAYINIINQQTMSLDNINTDVTEVAQVEMNLDEILGTPGAESVVLPEKETKPSIFSPRNEDLSFIDNPEDEEDPQGQKAPESIDDILKDIDPVMASDDESETKKSGGRPKLDKSGMAEVMNKLIEKGQIVPFDDDKSLDEYSIKDFEELLEANFSERENRIRQDTPVEFFEALPEELQIAIAS